MDAVAVQVQPQPQVQTQTKPAQQPQTQQTQNKAPQGQQEKELTLRDILEASGAVDSDSIQQAVQGGGFLAMMLQQMFGSMEQTEGALTGESLKALKAQLEKDGSELGAQMIMQMMMAGQSVTVADVSELFAQLTGEAVVQTGAVAAGTSTTDLLAAIASKPQETTVVQPQVANTSAVQAVVSAWKSAEQEAGASQGDALSGQAAFQQAVLAAQKLMKSDKGEAKESAPVDIDQLQSKVDAGKAGLIENAIPVQTLVQTQRAAQTEGIDLPDAADLLTQVKTGVMAGMNSGKNEFVVKLRPDGLGEITVKLVEANGGLSMSIITSNTQVQRLISGEMVGLREAMKPLGVEVQQVVSQDAGQFHADQQNNFGGHQHQQFHDNHTKGIWHDGMEQADDDTLLDEQGENQSAGMLNAYI